MTTDLIKKKKGKSIWESLADIAFFVWIICSFFDERSAIGRLSLIFFVGSVGLFIFFKAADIKKENKYPNAVKLFLVSYFAFYLYNYWRIELYGIILNYSLAASMLKTIMLNGIFIYFVYKYCVMKNDMDYIMNMYVFAQIVNVVVVIVRSGSGIFSGRLGGAVEINANVIALAMINCMVIVLHKNTKKKSGMNMLLLLFFAAVILITGSRKGLLGMALGIMLYFAMGSGFEKIKNIFIAVVLVVVAYLLIMNVDFLYDIAGHRVEALLSYFKGEGYNEGSLASRDDYAKLGWKYVAKKPWIGYGLANFQVLKGAYKTYSHNNYLELLFGCGIIGTVLYYLGYIYVLFGHIKLYLKKYVDSKPFIALITVQMFLEYAFVSYFERKSILFIILGWALLEVAKQKVKREETENEKIENAS